MTEAEPLVSTTEDDFWKSFMPAGTAVQEAMAVDQSGQPAARGSTTSKWR